MLGLAGLLGLAKVLPASDPPAVPTTVLGLAIWYDASQANLADGAAVAGLADLSGRGNDAVVSQGSPTWSSSGFGPGLPAVLCPGDAQFTLVGSPLVLSGGCAVFAVLVRSSGADFSAVGNSSPGLLLYASGNVYVADDSGSSASGYCPQFGPILARWLRPAAGQPWTVRVTGQIADLSLAGGEGSLSVIQLVHRTYDSGTDSVAELLFYDQAVSEESRAALEAYLSAKWSTPA